MRLILLLLIAFLMGNHKASAQDSIFGNLVDPNRVPSITSLVRDKNKALMRYNDAKDSYQDLTSKYTNSYGDQKILIGNQMLVKVQEIILHKIDSTFFYIERFVTLLDTVEGVSEESKVALLVTLDDFSTSVGELELRVYAATEIVELEVIAKELNAEIISVSDSVTPLALYVNSQGMVKFLEDVMEKSFFIQGHLEAALGVGGDVQSLQEEFDDAMVLLEGAKESYMAIVNNVLTDGISLSEYSTRLKSANGVTRKAYISLKDVIKELREVYSKSPWTIEE